jgi:inner membrane protein
MYSILDEEAVFEGFTVIPKQHELLHPAEGSRDLEVLQWFSDGYYSVFERGDTALQYNDLRFGSLNQSFEEPSDFVFHFILEQDEDGEWRARQGREQPGDMDRAFSRLWNRMMGRK